MLRVTQASLYRASVSALQDQYRNMATVQEQSLTSQHANKPSDDPMAAFRDLLLSNDLSQVESMSRTTSLAAERFKHAETALGDMHDKYLDAQDLVLQLGNSIAAGDPDVFTAASRKARALYDDVLKNANSQLDGVPLFGGSRTNLPFDAANLSTTPVHSWTDGSSDGMTLADTTQFTAAYDSTVGAPSVPSSVKVTYRTTDDTGAALATNVYKLNVNGVDLTDVEEGAYPQTLDLGDGMSLTVNSAPSDKQALFFEVVPSYQGGAKDREVRVASNQKFEGNVTGDEVIEGAGNGRGVNALGTLAGLEGALLRGDYKEVSAWLSPVQEARAQMSDLQAITGVRNVLMESVNTTLTDDQLILEETKALNIEVDIFEVMSRLQETSQAMQIMTVSERQVLDTSLLDFIR
ncbi:hypothetical protein [Magnetofaba australis]|nr:hypothetical protein [Magnetofaba australis]